MTFALSSQLVLNRLLSAEGFGLYQKFGFVRTQPDLACGPNGVVAVTPMRRSPRKASQSAKVTVHRVSDPAELPTLAALARITFSPHPTHRLTWANASPEDEQRWKVAKYTRSLEQANEHMFKAVDGRGDVVGFTLWKVSPAKDGAAKDAANAGDEDETLNFPEGVNLELMKEVFAKVDDLRKTYGNGGQYIRAWESVLTLYCCEMLMLRCCRPRHACRFANRATRRNWPGVDGLGSC